MVEVNVAVTLGLACARALCGGTEIAKLFGRVSLCVCVCSDGASCFGDLTRDFWRKSRTKRLIVRLEV